MCVKGESLWGAYVAVQHGKIPANFALCQEKFVALHQLKAFSSDQFVLPLPPGHRFPMQKYELLRGRVATAMPDVQLLEPPAATDGQLALAHDPDWIQRFSAGRISQSEQRAIGFPWSSAMVERSRRSAGATIAAASAAIEEGVAVNLAGGTHHAHAHRGEGFCCFNDVAVAARLMQAENRAQRVAIVDLDVHQGNGTASIFASDSSVFTLSLHGAANWPFVKACSDLDVGLPDGTSDRSYLQALEGALEQMFARFVPDLILYIAGADVLGGDRLGRLALTPAGIAQRDRMVFDCALRRGLPLAVTMGGGYCREIERTVAVHATTISLAAQLQLSWAAACDLERR
jgi:acetoin utilization deacetylase AcuC-like enzyme